MGSGLSMASVNKIKELANAREYGLALDILDSQDLTKSLNSQFLRLCGEIYMYNKRYKDARYVLLMAHRLAPEGKRVIYTLMVLYLKMGYTELARQYYNIYMADADENVLETKQTMYIYAKAAERQSPDELEHYIAPTYSNTMDYEWTYETILLYLMQGRRRETEALIQIYGATYRDSEHYVRLKALIDNDEDAGQLFNVFSDNEEADDDPEQEESRRLEAKLLYEDDLRINPREPEIVIMVDDNDDEEIVSKRKLKKMLREQERSEREAAEQEAEATDTGEASDADVGKPAESDTGERNADLGDTGTSDALDGGESRSTKTGFFKNIFSKTKKKDDSPKETADKPDTVGKTADGASNTDNGSGADEAEDKALQEEALRKAREIFFGEDEEDNNKKEDDSVTHEEDRNNTENTETADNIAETAEGIRDINDAEVIEESIADGEDDMREIHMKERNSIRRSIVTVDMGDDDFTAESDTIESLHDGDFSNPFDSIVAVKNDDAVQGYKIKKSISFETAELADEAEDSDYEIDDFSAASDESDEFGEMKILEAEPDVEVEEETEPEIETEIETEEEAEAEVEPEIEVETEEEAEAEVETEVETEEEAEAEAEPEIEEEAEAETEVEVEEEIEVEAEPEIEVETEEEAEAEVEPEIEVEIEEEAEAEVEPEIEVETEEEAEAEVETEVETEEEAEAEVEPEIEIETEEEAEAEVEPEIEIETEEETETEAEPEIEVETEEETEAEVEPEIEVETEEEAEAEPEIEEEAEVETEIEVEEETEAESEPDNIIPPGYTEQEIDDLFKVPPKKKLDFPVFKSSLFPDYHNEESEVENNFSEILKEAQDKSHDNILKEEEMMREAEELLASLGIDLGDIKAAGDKTDDISSAFNEGPSRDELKTSLKINSVQRDVLNKLKDYR